MEAEYIKMNLGGYLDLLDKLERPRTTMEDCSAVADALLANVALMCRADSIFQFTVPVLQKLVKVLCAHPIFLTSEKMAHFLAFVLKEALPVVDYTTLFLLLKLVLNSLLNSAISIQNEASSGMLPTLDFSPALLRLFISVLLMIRLQHGPLHMDTFDEYTYPSLHSLYCAVSSLSYTCLATLEKLLSTTKQTLTASEKQLICHLIELTVSLALLFNFRQTANLYASTKLSTLLEGRNYTYTTIVYQYVLRYFLSNSTEHIPPMFLSNILKKLVAFTLDPPPIGAENGTCEPAIKHVSAQTFASSRAIFQDILVSFYLFTVVFSPLQMSSKTPLAFAKLTQDGVQRVSILVRFALNDCSPLNRPYCVLLFLSLMGSGDVSSAFSAMPFKQMHTAFIDEFIRARGYELLFSEIADCKGYSAYSAMFLAHLYRVTLSPISSFRVTFAIPKEKIGGKLMSFQVVKANLKGCFTAMESIVNRLTNQSLSSFEREHNALLQYYFVLLSTLGRFIAYTATGVCVNIFSSGEIDSLIRQTITLTTTMQRIYWEHLNRSLELLTHISDLLVFNTVCFATHAGSALSTSLPATRKVDQSLLSAISELSSSAKLIQGARYDNKETHCSHEQSNGCHKPAPLHPGLVHIRLIGSCITALVLSSTSYLDRLPVVNQGLLQSAATLAIRMFNSRFPVCLSNLSVEGLRELTVRQALPPRPVSLEESDHSSRHSHNQLSSQQTDEELKSELQGEKLVRQQLQLQLKKVEETLSSVQQESDTRGTEIVSLRTIQEQTRLKVEDLEQCLRARENELSLKNTEVQLLKTKLNEAQLQLDSVRAALAQLEAECNAAHAAAAQYSDEATQLRSGMQSISLIVSDYAGYLRPRPRHPPL
ncbi:Hypothetical protein DHA2_152535 [Giardia duodenalis]|uniref:Uncharacterized protein n=1 Tax=Giardia intestinalis TaxID=5741 RepID=V6TE94_GIAIN|nr:Hypothetical protein DHA2_152535 [Giardia intestinalis]